MKKDLGTNVAKLSSFLATLMACASSLARDLTYATVVTQATAVTTDNPGALTHSATLRPILHVTVLPSH